MTLLPFFRHETDRPVVAVDLFCGVGGLTHGLRQEGVKVVAGYDLERDCKYAYEANNPGATFFERDICDLGADELAAHYPPDAVRVLVGCAPCQPYSSAAAKTKQGMAAEALEAEWRPLRKFLELILELRPDVVSMENVVRLATPGKFPVYAEFKEALIAAGYGVDEYRVYGPDYAIPQARRRLVLFASLTGRVDLPPKTCAKDAYPTVGEALAGLRPLEAGGVDPEDPMHRAFKLGELNLERARTSKPGGTWSDWPEELRLACHRKSTGATYGSVYGRMDAGAPSPTMTTQYYNIGTGRFVHPTQDRGLSLREGAILQTFPPEYRFVAPGGEIGFKRQGRQIGNAVPPMLGRVIGRSILAHLGRAEIAGPFAVRDGVLPT
ncbi:DNA cytosine methyltransferase [Deinococcus alpinitundrae]|uniref:DNA cytosine methyltransferase n=1 Tax=Deinococcus alpinitundrae TaxID=468913 RepID=UPI00137A96F6|nr:DNA cytosine methyltransferase [Deinococcus alpinitundrae]